VGASIGSSVYPHDGRSAEQLLGHADTAMFAMKTRSAA
jgi:predicted signal transduction protein with EAL and GGDEF domain